MPHYHYFQSESATFKFLSSPTKESLLPLPFFAKASSKESKGVGSTSKVIEWSEVKWGEVTSGARVARVFFFSSQPKQRTNYRHLRGFAHLHTSFLKNRVTKWDWTVDSVWQLVQIRNASIGRVSGIKIENQWGNEFEEVGEHVLSIQSRVVEGK